MRPHALLPLATASILLTQTGSAEPRNAAYRVPSEILYHYYREGDSALAPSLPIPFGKEIVPQRSLPLASQAHRTLTGAYDLYDLRPMLRAAGIDLGEAALVGFSPAHALIFARAEPAEIELLETLYHREDPSWTHGSHSYNIGISTTLLSTETAQSDGRAPADLREFIRVHPSAQIVARQRMNTRSGQRVKTVSAISQTPKPKHGNDEEALDFRQTAFSYQEIEADPVLGADGLTIELFINYVFHFALGDGAEIARVSHRHQFLTHSGLSHVIELGPHPAEPGRSLVLFARAYLPRADGTPWPARDLGAVWVAQNPPVPKLPPVVGKGGLRTAVIVLPRYFWVSQLHLYRHNLRRAHDDPFATDLEIEEAAGTSGEDDDDPFGLGSIDDSIFGKRYSPLPLADELAGIFAKREANDVRLALRWRIWKTLDGKKGGLAGDARAVWDRQGACLYLFASEADIAAVLDLVSNSWDFDFTKVLRATIQLPDRRLSTLLPRGSDAGFTTSRRTRKLDAAEVAETLTLDLEEPFPTLELVSEKLRTSGKRRRVEVPGGPARYVFALEPEGEATVTLSPEISSSSEPWYRRQDPKVEARWREHFMKK